VLALFWYFLLALELSAVMAIYLVVTRRQRPQDFGPMALAIAAGELALVAELGVQVGLIEMPAFSILIVVLPLLFGAVGTRLFSDVRARAARHRGRPQPARPRAAGADRRVRPPRRAHDGAARRSVHRARDASGSRPTSTTTSAPSS
jgi:hypothetical protein